MANWIDAHEAARLLGVSRNTLYSYVSRGLVRALPAPQGRSSVYMRKEVEALARRAAESRKPKKAARHTLDFGLPVLSSRLTLIADNQLWYRGQSVAKLAQSASLEDVACLLWGCAEEEAFNSPAPVVEDAWVLAARAFDALPPLERAMARLPAAAVRTPPSDSESAQCAALTRLMAASLLGTRPSALPLHEQCAQAWGVKADGLAPLRAALVLCADHELNASSFAARCVASTKAGLHAAVIGGLAALSGSRHGGATEVVETLWDEMAVTSPSDIVARYLEGGRWLPGFGHRLYPQGDVRAATLLALLPETAEAAALRQAAMDAGNEAPNIDFALVALRRALALPRGAAAILFALGRTVGWLGHALEQQKDGQLIRPRAQYVGIAPARVAPPGRVIRMDKRRKG